MVRRFSWCTAVALAVLLFVTTEGLRERGAQADDHKAANRGTLKYNSKSLEEATTASSASSLSRSRANRDRSAQSRRFSNIEGATQASTINSESSSSEPSIAKITTGITERNGRSTAIEVADESSGKTSDKKIEEVRKTEPAVNRRNGKRYFPENDEETRSKNNEQRVSVETSRGTSRRTSNGRSNSSRVTDRLDNKGPSVFLATTEPSRSRTGRKIQTTYSKKDLKTQISTSRRHSNKKFEDDFTTTSYRRGRSTTERIERSTRSGRSRANNTENDSVTRRGPDTLLSESESVRVDIPLVVNGNPVSSSVTNESAQRRSDTKEPSRSGRTGSERSKNRGRSNDSEVAGSSRGSSGSRRGSSKFGDSTTTTEANEQVVGSRRSTISRDRSRSSETGKKNSVTESRSRSRGRNLENNVKSGSNDAPERDAKRKVAGERSPSERRSRVLDGVSRVVESRGQDSQDVRGKSRNRSRSDVVRPLATDVTTTVAPETTVDVTTIDSEVTTVRPATPTTTSSSRSTSRPSPTSTSTTEASGRGRGRGRGGRKQKEDFFNYGLGFRGRKPSPEGSSNATQPRKTILWKNDTPINGNPGWTLRRRPGHFNNTANPSRTIVPSSRDQTNEVIPPNEESTSTEVATTTTESSTTSSSRRGFKKLQTIDESSTVAGTTVKSYRRGNKTFGNGKATAEREESDNYPPEFKARLTQLKNINTKIPAPKTTSRTQLEVKKSSAALFAERSRMKLDLARRLVKPELNIEENDLDATTASSFSKPRSTGGVPVLDETSKVAEHGKPAATASGGRSNRPSTSVESSREEVNAKSSRKDHEDSSKVTGRPNGLKKGRIIAERMVTSISIEERTAIEETTKPYVLSTNPSVIPPVEQGSETAADSTRIRQSGGRAGKKSKEEDSTIKNMKVSLYSTRRTETGDHVTTVKPKKPYVYQSRNTKFQLREQSTAMEQSSTTPSPKKPYAPTHRKSQTSQQDGVAKKTKFSNSAGKPMFRPRYSKRAKEKSSLDEKKTNDEDTITTKVPVPTSRYSRKKSLVKSIDDGSITTERSATQTKKLEFRPRTATYRRHSEIPTTFVESSTKVDKRAGVAITPRSTKYHATLKSTTASPRSVAQEPRVSLKIANESTSGIIDSSNGDTGNSNIFNPTRSTFLGGNNTLLEQLRSTVAPLLSSLGNKTPVFSESYSNVNNANSPSRITPSGQPPRFSARYKGAELFVRKQNNIYQPTVPSITSSSTTPVTPVENSGSAPPIDISSPGEPRFLTLYQALESASIRNEQLLRNASVQLQEQSDRVSQVDSNATAIANVIGDNANNDTTSPTVATVSPQTPDTIANTTQDSTQTPRFEDPENSTPAVTTRVPETPTTTDSVFTSAEPSSSTEQASTSAEPSSSTEQASTSAEPSSSTEQASTSAEPFSSTEQASTSAESLSSTEQISTSTDSSSTLEQFSVKIGSVPVTEPASTESSSQAADETTMNVTDAEDVRNSTSDNDSTNQELVSSTTDASTTSSVSEASSTELDGGTSFTGNNNEMQSSISDVTSRADVSENTTETTTITNMATTSENPEINTIPVSDVTVTQIANISSTDASTTEMDSNDVETTTTTSTSTIRTRLIDFAEDILSRLQATMSTTMQPSRDSTTTMQPSRDSTTTMQPSRDSTTTLPSAIDTEISNVVSDSNGNRSLESMSQLRDETTTSQGVTTDQSSLGTTEEVTTQNAVGSITTSSSTMVPSPEVSTQDELNAFTSTTPATITTTTATQDSQTVSNTDSTTVSDSNDSSSPTLNVEVTTASIVTSTNDTLLTELMSIAKTLLSEEINDTQEATAGQNSNVTSKLGDTMENEIDRPSLSNDVLSTTQATETSFVPLGVTTESVDSTSTTVVPPKSSTFFVDTPQNEVDSTTTISSENSTDTPTTIPRSNVSDDKVESVQNETTPIALEPFAEIVESTTPVEFTTEIGSRVTLSNGESADPDTTTQTQTIISTQSSDTTITSTVNFELTTNTFNLFSSNLVTTMNPQTASDQVAGSVTEPAGTTVTSQLVTDTDTLEPEVTTIAPETVPSLVNTITTTPFIPAETNQTDQTTTTPTIGSVQRVNDVPVETNQTTESTTQLVPLTTETADNETLEATTLSITTTAPLDVSFMDRVTINQSLLTSSPMPSTETTTNTPTENIPQTTLTLENETPTVVARFQDTTSTTAQRTAGSRIGQTTEISTPTIPDSSTTPSLFTEPPTSLSPESSLVTTTSFSVDTTTATTTTETTTPTSIGRVPDGGTSTPQTTRMDVVTVTPLTETTTTTTVNIEENLVSTETTTSTSPASSDSTTAMPTFTSTPGGVPTEATTMSVQTTPATTETTASPQSRLTFQSATTPYLGRFGGNRLTPAPRFSTSSSTRAPLRDYLVYGIYPNKTIVRKRPEDNLIDARNVDSPYVIFGIFPDGRLVRKFPNGTIIPDPPRRPVEVVFTLSTSTTTNRPLPRPYYNQANQGTYNRGPVYDYNGRPVAETMRNAQTPGTIDARLSGNAIVGPNGGGPDNTGPLGTPASLPSINEMSNALLNTQMGTASVTPIVSTGRPPTDSQGGRIVQDRERDEATRTKEAGGQRSSVYIGQDKFVNYWTDGASTSNPRVLGVNVNSVATATNEGPSPAVPSFENLLNNQPDRQVTAPPGFPWRDPLDQIFGITTSSPVITASVASNTLDDSSEPNPIAARPINPFVEVFTPFSNVIGVPKVNIGSIPPPPPPSSTTSTPTTSTATTTTMAPTTTTTMASTTTTTMAPTTTTTMAPTTTTTMAPTTTTTMAPTTTTTMAPTTTTTMAPTTITTMAPTISTTTARTTSPEPATTAQRASQVRTSGTATSSQTNSSDLRKNSQQQNTFGTTFDDLVFLNSLLQSNSRSTTQKTLTQVEQLLANKILELALKNPGPTRSPKAINIEKLPANSIYQSPTKSPSEPIIIELSPSSATSTPTWKSVETSPPTSQKPTISSSTPVQVTWKPVTTTTTERIVTSTVPSSTTIKTTLISTTKAPVTVKAKPATTPRPKTTTQAPLGFAGLLWQTLLGGNIFGPSTIPKPTKAKPVPKTTQKAVNITPKPLQTTKKIETTTIPSTTTLKAVDISKIHVSSPNSIINEKSVTTPRPISTTDQPLINNPNPRLPNVVTSTYSPEDDAKFLVELLRAVEQDNKIGSSKKKTSSLTRDDEAFLRAILSGRALVTPPPAPTSTTEVSNAALLAALLKAQGIQPSTPANNIREQLQLASLGQSVTSTPTTSPASESTTITTRPASTAANRPTDTTKKSVTPRPTSGPRIRTTTWSPSSTYPPSLFSSFGIPVQSVDNNSGNSALVGATRAFSQFLGAAISGAAQQLQSLVRNGTRIVSEVVG